jgi:hypothetical protein
LEICLIAAWPVSVNWDYDRFAEADKKKRESGKYFADVHLGKIKSPTTLVDMHGKIFMWYFPSLLLPQRVVCSASPVQDLCSC